jgi:integrase
MTGLQKMCGCCVAQHMWVHTNLNANFQCTPLNHGSCGLRVSELVSLDIDSIDNTQGFLRVVGKGSKMRHTPLGKPAQKASATYVGAHQP